MAATEPHIVDWPAYFAATIEKPLHPTYALLEPHLPTTVRVLELGCGVGHGVLYFVSRGFQVVAVDQSKEALEIVRSCLPAGASVEFVQSGFEDLDLAPLGTFDVIVAEFSLFFLPPPAFRAFWARMMADLKPGGLFMGQLLGVNDEWAPRGYTVLTRAGVEQLLAPFETLHLEEVDLDGETSQRVPKHWHIFHFIARKRP
ncbi:MAG: class I SAM-dependent methyltransferase [Fimbriimonas ginsengisoli]|uniref:Class I SAM-dependent methyltransferase n=1 Tax=Fimbriimonas ginsengisoli TaxID=1005039 RepID=A0A931LYW2_FIMGI|nr:class I SAM-dependent methyltransferase [Fimbriimonas ginsengisoli]